MDNSPEEVKRRFDAACDEIRSRVKSRAALCDAIAFKARRFGLDVSPEVVYRHFDWFQRWDSGLIAKGYLIKRTGVQLIETKKVGRK